MLKAKGYAKRAIAAIMLASMTVATPAHAQFTKGFKFLEAVKKKDGVKVEEAVSEPGSTVINARDVTTGESALHIVTQRRDITWLRYLVAKGANVNLRDDRGQTALQLATNVGWLDGVEYLVSKNADVDESNDTGETPLISAVHRKNIALMKALLKGGADPDRADNSGRSARDYALLSGADSQLVATIDTHANVKSRAGAKGVYGPTF